MICQSNRAYGLVPMALTLAFLLSARGEAQSPPGAKTAAPIDLTGYWVSIVTQDWRQRMITPPVGDYASVPITAAAKKVGDAWDPEKDVAAGEQCRSYGAPAIMRIPGRLHITWQDENTLKMEADAGTQIRLFHFGSWKPQTGQATWQGDSVAQWEAPPVGRGGSQAQEPKSGSLKVVTTHVRPGYLRKNGVPYSANVVMTEYWDLVRESDGEQWIEITNVVEDSMYLRQPWITALHFKKEATGAKWEPTACSATW